MTQDLAQKLQDELKALRKQLEETEIYKNIQAVERVLSLLGHAAETAHVGKRTHDGRTSYGGKVTQINRPESATTAALKAAAEEFLRGKTVATTTREILEALISRGITVPGESPMNNLSAHLSRDSRFLSWGREGWTLAELIVVDGDELKQMASDYVSRLAEDTKGELLEDVRRDPVEAPGEQERQLLQFARARLLRNLTDDEKRILRRAVMIILDDLA